MGVPLDQLRGSGHSISVVLRATPQSGESKPIDYQYHYDLPPIPERHATGEFRERFALPPGSYRVSSLARDDAARVCSGAWSVTIHSEPAPRPAPVERLTVFLDAAPQDPRALKLSQSDVARLTDSLAALLERLPARSVRVVAFNLESEAELFRSNRFQAEKIEEVAQVLNDAQFTTVDYRNLQNHKGPARYVADLIHREWQEPGPSRAAIFLGWLGRSREPVPSGPLDPAGAGRPKFFYIQYRPPPGQHPSRKIEPVFRDQDSSLGVEAPVPPGETIDTIDSAMRRIGGRTIVTLTPSDFAHGLSEIAARLPR